jgi:hypothetical protein
MIPPNIDPMADTPTIMKEILSPKSAIPSPGKNSDFPYITIAARNKAIAGIHLTQLRFAFINKNGMTNPNKNTIMKKNMSSHLLITLLIRRKIKCCRFRNKKGKKQ